MITVERPITAEYKRRTTGEAKARKRIPIENFWTLIAWHELTQLEKPGPIKQYDKRAMDIWEAITNAEETSGGPKLCWAADRLLLDILIDELGCERELFSNILNTYHRFKQRCMLQENESFAKQAGIEIDGLRPNAYRRCVYGNPPFDGNVAGRNTIIKTLDAAQKASTETASFRAVFFLPLTDERLRARLSHPRAKLLMKFPNDTVPFIPDNYWYGGKKARGCYKEKHTHMVLIMYESEDTGVLSPVNYDTLHQKLASWFINKTPVRNHVKEKLLYTGIPIEYYNNVLRARYPESWKFWKHKEHSENPAYHGAPHDTNYTNQTPFWDIINWDTISAHVGHLPDTFDKFLREIGVQAKQVKETATEVEKAMKAHTIKMFKIYWKETREGGDRSHNHEKRENTDNEDEMNDDTIDRISSLGLQEELTWMVQEDSDSFDTDDEATLKESDLGSDEEDIDDRLDLLPQPIFHTHPSSQTAPLSQEALGQASRPLKAARQTSITNSQHLPPTRRSQGICKDKGIHAWLSLEQVASIIQLHNTRHRIRTTLLQGVRRQDWDTVWKHMRAIGTASVEGTDRPAPRMIRNAMMSYGQHLFQHKQDKTSGVYPMHIPGHWRVMIVSHKLKQVVLLDPFGGGFTEPEVNNIKHTYQGYVVNTRKARLQTDTWNCGVWVAWAASLWATHVNQGLEGTKNIDKVIQEGMSLEGISDINLFPSGKLHNESCILQIRQRYRQMLHANSQPKHYTDWLTEWKTPLTGILTARAEVNLAGAHHTASTSASQPIDLNKDAENADTHRRPGNSTPTQASHPPPPLALTPPP